MKTTLSFLFVLSINNCYCATGNASDGELLTFVVLALLALILGIGYFIDFLKHVFKTASIKKWFRKRKADAGFNNTFHHDNTPFSRILPD